jgi:hypothetical protein
VAVPHEALDCLVLAWHQDHVSSQSGVEAQARSSTRTRLLAGVCRRSP